MTPPVNRFAVSPSPEPVAPPSGWIDLSGRSKFRLTGPDRVRYLNGQVTQNVARLRPGEAVPALVCNAKGKLEAEIVVRADEECLWIDAPGPLRESLLARLEKFLIADDCAWDDVTDAYALWHGLGVADASGSDTAGSDAARRVCRFGPPGIDLWLPVGTPGPDGPRLGEAEAEALRLDWGVPAWGSELTPDTLPQEARLEETAVDFHKGCYVGQEVVSRLRSVGKVNRLLCRLETVGDSPLAAGDRLFAASADPDAPAQEVGSVTSALHFPHRGRTLALGYLKRSAFTPGATFQAGPDKNALSTAVKCRETAPASDPPCPQ